MVDKVYYDFDKMYVNEKYMEEFLAGNFRSLLRAFDWEDTPQGEAFWFDVFKSESIKSTVLKELEVQYWDWFIYGSDEEDFDLRVHEVKVDEEETVTYDPVDKPAHYNMGGIECIDYIKQVLGLDGFIAYCHGNMIKYQHRYRYKQNPREDMKKAQWYLNKMNEALEEKYK